MNYTSKINLFNQNNRKSPNPDVDVVINDVFPALATSMISSAEAMSYVMIERVRELENDRNFNKEMAFWVWRNFKIGIFKLVETFSTISITYPEIFKKVLHDTNSETVMAMFIWSADPLNKDHYKLMKMFLELMYESEINQ